MQQSHVVVFWILGTLAGTRLLADPPPTSESPPQPAPAAADLHLPGAAEAARSPRDLEATATQRLLLPRLEPARTESSPGSPRPSLTPEEWQKAARSERWLEESLSLLAAEKSQDTRGASAARPTDRPFAPRRDGRREDLGLGPGTNEVRLGGERLGGLTPPSPVRGPSPTPAPNPYLRGQEASAGQLPRLIPTPVPLPLGGPTPLPPRR